LHQYSSCLHWVWTIPHFTSCSSQLSASSSMLEHISGIQYAMADLFKQLAHQACAIYPAWLWSCWSKMNCPICNSKIIDAL
jgi:hypothetical protein